MSDIFEPFHAIFTYMYDEKIYVRSLLDLNCSIRVKNSFNVDDSHLDGVVYLAVWDNTDNVDVLYVYHNPDDKDNFKILFNERGSSKLTSHITVIMDASKTTEK